MTHRSSRRAWAQSRWNGDGVANLVPQGPAQQAEERAHVRFYFPSRIHLASFIHLYLSWKLVSPFGKHHMIASSHLLPINIHAFCPRRTLLVASVKSANPDPPHLREYEVSLVEEHELTAGPLSLLQTATRTHTQVLISCRNNRKVPYHLSLSINPA